MRDDFLSADWADHHNEMSSGVDGFISAIGAAFVTLVAHQFEAPWKRDECDANG